MVSYLGVRKPCQHKDKKRSNAKDRLSKLPDEILLSMISSFTMKEATTLGLVSHQLESIRRRSPVLIFEKPRSFVFQKSSMTRVFKELHKERLRFARWTDRVLEKHSGDVIDELRIAFDLDQKWQSFVDKWAAVALDKRVQRLELDFSSLWRQIRIRSNGVDKRICGKPLDLPPKFTSIHSSMKSLCLKYVNATDEFVDCLPRSCPFLQSLCIVGSECLTKVSGLLEQATHLEVSDCDKLKTIDISAPKLRSFVHYNRQIELLHIAHASSLSEVSIGDLGNSYRIAFVLDSLSEYSRQLVSLTLKMSIKDGSRYGSILRPVNLVIDNPSPLPNLQHLELRVNNMMNFGEHYLRGWTSLIAASPNILKLTLKLYFRSRQPDLEVSRWVGFPLKCLKTLELVGYVGRPMDLELAFFVFENAPMLEEVIVDFAPEGSHGLNLPCVQERERLGLLKAELPQGVKLIIKE